MVLVAPTDAQDTGLHPVVVPVPLQGRSAPEAFTAASISGVTSQSVTTKRIAVMMHSF